MFHTFSPFLKREEGFFENFPFPPPPSQNEIILLGLTVKSSAWVMKNEFQGSKLYSQLTGHKITALVANKFGWILFLLGSNFRICIVCMYDILKY